MTLHTQLFRLLIQIPLPFAETVVLPSFNRNMLEKSVSVQRIAEKRGGKQIRHLKVLPTKTRGLANAAESTLLCMEKRNEGIVLIPAISTLDLGRVMRVSEKFSSEVLYLAARSVAETLHRSGLISSQELTVIDTILLDKYKPTLSGLLSGKSTKIVDLS